MNRTELIHYMLDLSVKDFDRVFQLYSSYSSLPENERNNFLRELDGFDRGLLKEISAAEKIYGHVIKEDFERRGHKVIPGSGGWGFVLSDIRFRRMSSDLDYFTKSNLTSSD